MLETPNCVTLQETNILNISLAGEKEHHLQKILGRGYVTSHAGIQGSYMKPTQTMHHFSERSLKATIDFSIKFDPPKMGPIQ